MQDTVLIQVSNLSRDYGQLRAVDNISFEARRGEVLGFLGPNGAGKSSTTSEAGESQAHVRQVVLVFLAANGNGLDDLRLWGGLVGLALPRRSRASLADRAAVGAGRASRPVVRVPCAVGVTLAA